MTALSFQPPSAHPERSRGVTAPTSGTRPSTTLGTSETSSAGPTSTRDAQMRQAAEAFEAVFLRQLIGSMRQAKLGEDLFGSDATNQFRDMADSRLADSMAEQRSFGIADLLLQQFNAVIRRAEGPAEAAAVTPAPAGITPTNPGDGA